VREHGSSSITCALAAMALLCSMRLTAAQSEPVSLVSRGTTLYRVNAACPGQGEVEAFPGQPGIIIGMTEVPAGVAVTGCKKGDILAVEAGGGRRFWRIDNARVGLPTLVSVGNFAASIDNPSSIAFARGRLFSVSGSGQLVELDPVGFKKISETSILPAGQVGGLTFDGLHSWFVSDGASDQIWNIPFTPAPQNEPVAIGLPNRALDFRTNGLEMFGDQLWAGVNVTGKGLRIGTFDLQSGEFDEVWEVDQRTSSENVGYVIFEPAADVAREVFKDAAVLREQNLRLRLKTSVKEVQHGLKASLSTFAADGELPAAVESAVSVMVTAMARNANASEAGGAGLAAVGAGLLESIVGEIPRDFIDGGGGTWDRFKVRSEAALSRTDSRLRVRFTRFVRSATKVAAKQGHDPDLRYAVRGHDLLLQAVPGPVLLAAGAPRVLDVHRAQFVLDVRFVTARDELMQTVGIHHRGTGTGALVATDAAGQTFEASGLEADADGVLVVPLLLEAGIAGPITTRFSGSDDAILAAVQGSAPTRALTDELVVQEFRLHLQGLAATVGKQLRQQARDFQQLLKALAKEHTLGQVPTLVAISTAVSAFRSALGDANTTMGAARNDVMTDAAAAIAAAGGSDDDVEALFMPDADGDAARWSARLFRLETATSAKRAKGFAEFMQRITEQAAPRGETLLVSAVYEVPREPASPLLQIDTRVAGIGSDPEALLGGSVGIEGPDIGSLFFVGKADAGLLRGTDTSIDEQPGSSLEFAGHVQEAAGAFEVQIPALVGGPVVGWLLSTSHDDREKPSMLLLATPRIVQDCDG